MKNLFLVMMMMVIATYVHAYTDCTEISKRPTYIESKNEVSNFIAERDFTYKKEDNSIEMAALPRLKELQIKCLSYEERLKIANTLNLKEDIRLLHEKITTITYEAEAFFLIKTNGDLTTIPKNELKKIFNNWKLENN